MDNNIILIGMPGSGKSSVGVVLAKALGYGFVDVDLLIQERTGALLQEILDRDGVERFLDLERDVLCSVDCARSVIAPGGSCVCREASIAHMRQLGTVVYLELSLPEVERRIHNLATGASPCPLARPSRMFTPTALPFMSGAPTSPCPRAGRACPRRWRRSRRPWPGGTRDKTAADGPEKHAPAEGSLPFHVENR